MANEEKSEVDRQETAEHPVQRLWALLDHFGSYPEGVEPMKTYIGGDSFFPGGVGLASATIGNPLPDWPLNGVMVVAHNFDCAAGYERSLIHPPIHDTSVTRRMLDRELRKAGILLKQCFYTNAFVGLKAGTTSIGKFPGSYNVDFVNRCRDFLLRQIQLQQPWLLLTLGNEVPPVLAPLVPELQRSWAGAHTLREIDERQTALVFPVQFPDVLHFTTVVALTHPAIWSNVRYRRYNTYMGAAAEEALLRDGISHCAF